MKTLTATAALTVMFLSAGAIAGNDPHQPRATLVQPANMTVIMKNQSWPVKGRITVESCKLNRCIDV